MLYVAKVIFFCGIFFFPFFFFPLFFFVFGFGFLPVEEYRRINCFSIISSLDLEIRATRISFCCGKSGWVIEKRFSLYDFIFSWGKRISNNCDDIEKVYIFNRAMSEMKKE